MLKLPSRQRDRSVPPLAARSFRILDHSEKGSLSPRTRYLRAESPEWAQYACSGRHVRRRQQRKCKCGQFCLFLNVRKYWRHVAPSCRIQTISTPSSQTKDTRRAPSTRQSNVLLPKRPLGREMSLRSYRSRSGMIVSCWMIGISPCHHLRSPLSRTRISRGPTSDTDRRSRSADT